MPLFHLFIFFWHGQKRKSRESLMLTFMQGAHYAFAVQSTTITLRNVFDYLLTLSWRGSGLSWLKSNALGRGQEQGFERSKPICNIYYFHWCTIKKKNLVARQPQSKGNKIYRDICSSQTKDWDLCVKYICNSVGSCNLIYPFLADSGMLATGEVIWVDGHITSGEKINTIVTTWLII